MTQPEKIYELIEHQQGHGMGWPDPDVSRGFYSSKKTAIAAAKDLKKKGYYSMSLNVHALDHPELGIIRRIKVDFDSE